MFDYGDKFDEPEVPGSVFDGELFEQLAVAVFAGDLGKAETLLAELQMIGGEAVSDMVRRAKRKARPGLAISAAPPAKPWLLPVPGHLPMSTLGKPIMAEDGAVL